MSNSKLAGKLFPVPDKVLRELNKNLKKFSDKNKSKGYNRAHFIVKNKACTYEQLKRIKNYFDYVTDDNYNEVEYLLNGGDMMRNWVNYTLDQARKGVYSTKSARKNACMDNQFRSSSEDSVEAVTPKLKNVPEFMSSNDLMEEVNKIKKIIKQLTNG